MKEEKSNKVDNEKVPLSRADRILLQTMKKRKEAQQKNNDNKATNF